MLPRRPSGEDPSMGRLQRSRRLCRQSRFVLAIVVGGLIPAISAVAKPLHVSATSVYETNVKNDSPKVYYRLDESSGTTATDDSGNSVTGTYRGTGITYSVAGASGDGDNAITDNSDCCSDVTAVDTSLPTGHTDRTMEIWIKKPSAPTSGVYFMYYGSAPAGQQSGMFLGTDGTICMCMSADNLSLTPPYSVTDGNWHMVDMVLSSSTSVKLYVDGHPSGTGTLPSTPNTTVGAGDMGLNVGGVNGSLDEAVIYPSALSAADISTRWQTAVGATSCPSPPTTGYAGAVRSDIPKRYYRLNESSGVFALDSSS